MMGKWVRGGEPPDEIKVTFVVNARKDPELAAWLWALPYRGTSASVRDILSAAARRLGMQIPAAVTTVAQRDSPEPASVIPAGANPTTPQPVALAATSLVQGIQSDSDALGQEGMTDAVAKLMREMDDEF